MAGIHASAPDNGHGPLIGASWPVARHGVGALFRINHVTCAICHGPRPDWLPPVAANPNAVAVAVAVAKPNTNLDTRAETLTVHSTTVDTWRNGAQLDFGTVRDGQ